MVYVNGEEYGSAEQYYQESSELAAAVPETTDEQEWLPLGVFALTSEGVNASSMYLQLAVSKEGIIAGTFYNESTGATHPLEGMVDEKTQRAVWKAADGTNANLVMETGVYNLTQMSFGFSRDDTGGFLPDYLEGNILEADPFQTIDQEGVGQLIRLAVQRGRATRGDLKVGICGEQGGDPASVDFCFKTGLNYVSCSPYRVPIALLAAAQAAITNK